MIGHPDKDVPTSAAHSPGMGGAMWGDGTLPWQGPYVGKQPRNGTPRQWPAGPDNGGPISAHIMHASNKISEHNIGQLPPILVQWQPPAQMQSAQTSKIVSGGTIINTPRIIVGNPFGGSSASGLMNKLRIGG